MKPSIPLSPSQGLKRGSLGLALVSAMFMLQGCTVLAVADVVGTVAVKTVGLAADAAIGVVKISGQAIGAAADAVLPEGKD